MFLSQSIDLCLSRKSPVAQVVGSQGTTSFTHNESFHHFSNCQNTAPFSLTLTFIPGSLCSLF